MAAFAGYGFPKAHAASYAQIGWRAAWCKTHYPAVFMAAVLANWGGYYRQGVYLTEVRRRGMKLRPPHVNFARREFSVRYLDGEPVLFMGLDQVKELTRRTQLRILRERPFKSLEDFLVRVDPRSVEAENLVRVGALAGMGTIPALLSALQPGGWRGGQLFLFPFESISGNDSVLEDWTLEQKVYAQEEILGAGVDAHRLELFADQIKAAHALNTLDAASQVGRHVRVAGMRQTWRRSRTAGGEAIYFMSFEDLDGMLDVVILSDVYRRSRSALKEVGPYLVDGLVEVDRTNGEPFIRAERIFLLR
jgi:DNA polymerase III alpha subunit